MTSVSAIREGFEYRLCWRITFAVFALILACAAAPSRAQEMNGFDVSKTTIPREQIHHGGPAKDGIPAIDRPVFVSADLAGSFLQDADGVLGVVRGGAARAYPIRILNWHEIVNDRIGGEVVVVTYCPL